MNLAEGVGFEPRFGVHLSTRLAASANPLSAASRSDKHFVRARSKHAASASKVFLRGGSTAILPKSHNTVRSRWSTA